MKHFSTQTTIDRKDLLVLHYTSIVLIVISLIELILAVLTVVQYDLSALTNSAVGKLLIFQAGNSAVTLIFAFTGAAAGYAGLTITRSQTYNSYVRWFGIALVVIYVIEGIMMAGSTDTYSWIRLIILLVLALLYIWSDWSLSKNEN